MIAHLQGQVLFSDGNEIIVLTNSGIGYQVHYSKILAEGHDASIYVSHVIRENSQELFGFQNLKDKKLFEMILTVSGVGPKGAYSLISALGNANILSAIETEDKKSLTKAKGVGAKAASQIILDLANKIHRIRMYGKSYQVAPRKINESLVDLPAFSTEEMVEIDVENNESSVNQSELLNEALLACKELGFSEKQIIPLAQKLLATNTLEKAEQLVHLVLKEI